MIDRSDTADVAVITYSESETQADNSIIISAINGLKIEFLSRYGEVLAAVS